LLASIWAIVFHFRIGFFAGRASFSAWLLARLSLVSMLSVYCYLVLRLLAGLGRLALPGSNVIGGAVPVSKNRIITNIPFGTLAGLNVIGFAVIGLLFSGLDYWLGGWTLDAPLL